MEHLHHSLSGAVRRRVEPSVDRDVAVVYSDIPGATVYIGGIAQQRVTPLLAKFEAAKGFFKHKDWCAQTAPIVVRWVSGAEASLIAALSQFGFPRSGPRRVNAPMAE